MSELGDIREQYRRLRRNFERVTTAIENEAQYAAQEIAFEILKQAQENAPVSSAGDARYYPGYLKASGYVNKPYDTNGGTTTVLGFRAHYAMAAHEDPRVGKNTGGPKFLLRAFESVTPKAVPRMKRRIDNSIGAVLRTVK